MFLRVESAAYAGGYTVRIRFNDGSEGEVDLSSELEGEVFGALRDTARFRSFRVDPEVGTLVWENGADLAPEFLHEAMRVLT